LGFGHWNFIGIWSLSLGHYPLEITLTPRPRSIALVVIAAEIQRLSEVRSAQAWIGEAKQRLRPDCGAHEHPPQAPAASSQGFSWSVPAITGIVFIRDRKDARDARANEPVTNS
jgi:hypothetical protein